MSARSEREDTAAEIVRAMIRGHDPEVARMRHDIVQRNVRLRAAAAWCRVEILGVEA